MAARQPFSTRSSYASSVLTRRHRTVADSATRSTYRAASIVTPRTTPASIQLRFRHTIEGDEDRYVLKRSWAHTNGQCSEVFHVLKNDRLAPALADNWAFQVEDLMPANIAHLFLFDGEQIERYASPVESASLIGTAIQNLLGLDIVDQLEKDMRVFERRKRSEQIDDQVRAKIASAESELQDLRARISRTRQDRAALRTHRIEASTVGTAGCRERIPPTRR